MICACPRPATYCGFTFYGSVCVCAPIYDVCASHSRACASDLLPALCRICIFYSDHVVSQNGSFHYQLIGIKMGLLCRVPSQKENLLMLSLDELSFTEVSLCSRYLSICCIYLLHSKSIFLSVTSDNLKFLLLMLSTEPFGLRGLLVLGVFWETSTFTQFGSPSGKLWSVGFPHVVFFNSCPCPN